MRTPWGRRATALAATLTSVAVVAAPTPPAAAAPRYAQAGFGVQTASDGRPDGRGIVTYGVTPGATQRDQFAVVNIGRTPLTLDVYATDATSGANGEIGLRSRTSTPTDVGRWIELTPRTVRVPARTSRGPSFVVVPYRVVVPKDATPGDHIGGIVASLSSKARNRGGVDVTLDQRVALSVVARVSGTVRATLAVEDVRVAWHGPALTGGNPFAHGSATVTYRVHNTGNVQLGATQEVSVDPSLGGAVGPRVADVSTLLPGASTEQTVRVPGVFPGVRLTADVTVTPVAAGDPATRLRPVHASAGAWAVPWLLLVLLVLVLGAAVAVALRVRTLRRRPAEKHRRTRRSVTAGPS